MHGQPDQAEPRGPPATWSYTDVYGDRVVEIEYTDNGRSAFTKACRARGATISVDLRDRDVVPVGLPGHVDDAC